MHAGSNPVAGNMKAYILQENNPRKKDTRVIGMSNSFIDIASLAALLYPDYEEYAGAGLFYNKKSLAKSKKVEKLKNIRVIEFDFGNIKESFSGIPIKESDIEVIEKFFRF